MSAAIGILWFFGLIITVYGMFTTLGWSGIVNMFPEGRRWWMLPIQYGFICAFAAIVHFNPWI